VDASIERKRPSKDWGWSGVKMIQLNDFSREFTNDALDIRDRQVVDRDQQVIGRVDSMFVDDFQRKVRFLGVELEGDADSRVMIPVDAILQVDKNRLLIDQPRRRVLDSPSPDQETATPSEEYWVRVYDHYGYSPHWTAGNVFPGYPSR
jgi:PRC-barrel domain